MSEIFLRFRALRFFVVSSGGHGTAKQLVSYAPAYQRVGQCIYELNHSRSVIEQPLSDLPLFSHLIPVSLLHDLALPPTLRPLPFALCLLVCSCLPALSRKGRGSKFPTNPERFHLCAARWVDRRAGRDISRPIPRSGRSRGRACREPSCSRLGTPARRA